MKGEWLEEGKGNGSKGGVEEKKKNQGEKEEERGRRE